MHGKRQVTIKFQWTLPLEGKNAAKSDHNAICVARERILKEMRKIWESQNI